LSKDSKKLLKVKPECLEHRGNENFFHNTKGDDFCREQDTGQQPLQKLPEIAALEQSQRSVTVPYYNYFSLGNFNGTNFRFKLGNFAAKFGKITQN
jgi:hypothetical protein